MTSGARKPVRVLVVDNEVLICRLLCTDLASEPDFIVLEPCFSGEDAVATVLAEPPEIVLMDLQMPGMDGFTAIERILAAGVPTRVIALTGLDNGITASRVFRAGGHGCLPKTVSSSALANAIRLVADDDEVIVLPHSLRTRLGTALSPFQLTERQLTVLEGVAAGSTLDELAASIFASTTTVKSELKLLETKLGVKGRIPLATRARELGLG